MKNQRKNYISTSQVFHNANLARVIGKTNQIDPLELSFSFQLDPNFVNMDCLVIQRLLMIQFHIYVVICDALTFSFILEGK